MKFWLSIERGFANLFVSKHAMLLFCLVIIFYFSFNHSAYLHVNCIADKNKQGRLYCSKYTMNCFSSVLLAQIKEAVVQHGYSEGSKFYFVFHSRYFYSGINHIVVNVMVSEKILYLCVFFCVLIKFIWQDDICFAIEFLV